MTLRLGKRFWMGLTLGIFVFTMLIMGRNLLHVIKIKRQINALEREQSYYRNKIVQDSTLVEHLRYDDYLEEYAREKFHMQRRDERVFILKD